jgi:hypothetical protein
MDIIFSERRLLKGNLCRGGRKVEHFLKQNN